MASFSSQFRAPSAPSNDGPSVSEALAALEGAASTPRQHAIVKSARNAFASSGKDQSSGPPASPGQRAARGNVPPQFVKGAKG